MDRQTAQNLLDNLVGMVEDTQDNDYDTALKMGIEALKAHTQPVRKTGRWIERWHDNKHVIGDMACSVCGAQMLLTFPRFCPCCGAYMRGEQDG